MLDRLANQKWIYVMLSVLLATMFWFYVRKVEDPVRSQTVRSVPVVLTGENILNSQGLTVSSVSHETVDITVRANISALDQLNRRSMSVQMDVSKCAAAGEYELGYTVVLPANINSGGVAIENRTPQYLTIWVEKLYTNSFPVEFSLSGSVAEGFQTGQYTVNPEAITVSGPEEQVSRVSRVVAVLEREGLKERFSGELPLRLLDEQGNILTDLDVKLSAVSAYVTLPVLVVREIPLTVHFTPGGGATEADITSLILPGSITVSGAQEDMQALREISLGSVDLARVVGTGSFTFPITLDPALENVSGISEATVTVTVSGLDTRALDVINIELVNLPAGYTAEVATQMRTVVLRGRAAALEQIDPSQVRIAADLSSVSAVGTVSVPVRVYLDAVGDVGVVGDYSIVVKVSR